MQAVSLKTIFIGEFTKLKMELCVDITMAQWNDIQTMPKHWQCSYNEILTMPNQCQCSYNDIQTMLK